MIKIAADSTCDLSKELIEKYNIAIIPLHIVLEDKEYRDGIDIMPGEIYEWSDKNNTTPKTSAVGFDDAMDTVRPLVGNNDEMIIFTISEKMSTTANVFRMAAEELEVEDRVSVIESSNLSTGISLLIIEAAIMAAEGRVREEIADFIEDMKPRVRSSFVVDTLTYLHRGGRCSSVAALAGGMLKLHPKIVVEDGAMHATKKYRGKMNGVILDYAKDMEEDLKQAKKDRVFITHSGCEQETIDKVKEYLLGLEHFDEILVTRAGGVISSHCGPGTLGVLYIK